MLLIMSPRLPRPPMPDNRSLTSITHERYMTGSTARGESLAAFDGRCIPAPPQRGCRVGDPGLAALLLAQILPVFSVVAPCHRGASPVSVRRQTFATGC